MTTNSGAYLASRIAEELATQRPDLNVQKCKIVRRGAFRLLQVTLGDGRYAQVSCTPLGSHTGRLITQAVEDVQRIWPR